MCGWLIERKDRRLLREAHGDGGELSLSGAEGAHITALKMRCANSLDGSVGALTIVFAWSGGTATVWDATECHELLNARGEWERDVGAHHGD